MKKYFITGTVILLPLALTLAIVIFVVNLLTEPFVGIVGAILERNQIWSSGFLFLSASQVQKYVSQLIILILLFFFTVGLGFLARWFFFHYLIRLWEYVLHRIPLISTVYKTCQDIIKTLFADKNKSFKQVVMVPFPSPQMRAVGLVTRDQIPSLDGSESPLVAVFIPTTPNPTSGFLIVYKEEDLIYLDMKVEEALKYVISCGVISAPFHSVSKKALKEMENGKET